MYAYCVNNPVSGYDPFGQNTRLVGLGAQVDICIGNYEFGVEVIVYWDETVCAENNGEPLIAVYAYEGISISLDDLLANPCFGAVVTDLSMALLTDSIDETNAKAELIAMQAVLTKSANASISVVAVFGNDDFHGTSNYEGPFECYSFSINHVKVGYAYSDSCWALSVGATTTSKADVSTGVTNYVQINK